MNGHNGKCGYMDVNEYSDIINHPHHVSQTRPQMSMHDRAAQFAPFAALTGHDAAVAETARLTDRRMELDENELQHLDEQLSLMKAFMERSGEDAEGEHMVKSDGRTKIMCEKNRQPYVSITYFIPDKYKEGGAYVTETGRLKKIDEYERVLLMETDGREDSERTGTKRIPIREIISISCDLKNF